MLLNRLRITDQMAIIEARVYADKDDPVPLASFTSMQEARNIPGGPYLRVAQDEALNEALDNAGFGIQLCDVAQVSDGSGYGSEIPVAKAEEAVHTPPAEPMLKQLVVQAEEESAHDASAASEMADTQVQEQAVSADPPVQPEKTAPQPEPESESGHTEALQTQIKDDPVQRGQISTLFPQPEADAEDGRNTGTESAESAQESEASAVQASYTEAMCVEEICQRMTLEEARQVKVPLGTCKGWTLGQVETDRPSSFKWYLMEHTKVSNIVKAGASLLLEQIKLKKAG